MIFLHWIAQKRKEQIIIWDWVTGHHQQQYDEGLSQGDIRKLEC